LQLQVPAISRMRYWPLELWRLPLRLYPNSATRRGKTRNLRLERWHLRVGLLGDSRLPVLGRESRRHHVLLQHWGLRLRYPPIQLPKRPVLGLFDWHLPLRSNALRRKPVLGQCSLHVPLHLTGLPNW